MSDINLDFTVTPINANIVVDTNDITFTPSAINLSIYTGGFASPSGGTSGNTQVQFNNNGVLGGDSNLIYNNVTKLFSASNVTIGTNANIYNANIIHSNIGNANITNANITTANLGSVTELTILGGGNGQFLSTDGNGNMSFSSLTANGSNSQLQYNNNGVFGGIPNVTYGAGNLSLGNVSNVKMTGGTANYVLKTDGAGNLSWTQQIANTVAGGGNQQLQYNSTGNLGGISSITWDGTSLTYSNVANIKIPGGSANYVLKTDGLGNLSWTAQTGGNGGGVPGGSNTYVQYNNAGNFGGSNAFIFNSASNLVSITGGISITGTTTLAQGIEKTTSNSATSGTLTYDYLDTGAIIWLTNSLAGNLTVNVRGNSTTTFLSTVTNWQTVTLVLVTTVGATRYVPSVFQIDGSLKTVKWVNNIPPTSTNIYANSVTAYTYTITRQLLNNYTILGSFTGYL